MSEQTSLDKFHAFEQPPLADRDTFARTIVFQIPTLTAKKSGLLNRAMKDYRLARQLACEYFRDHDASEFTISDQNELSAEIAGQDEIDLSRRQVAYAIRTVHQNYREFQRELHASPPEANRADTLSIPRRGTRVFYEDGRYYLNVQTGLDTLNLPLRTSSDTHHADYLPYPSSVPDKESTYQQRAGVKFSDLSPEDFPSRTQKLSTSTLQKRGERRFTANLTVQIATRQERSYDAEDARYIVSVDRGRNQLAHAALYDSDEDHVVDWWNRGGDEVEHYMTQFAERISEFQSAGVWDEMADARQRRFRYKKQVDYEIANALVDLARGTNGSVAIVMEELSGMSRLGSYSVENRRFSEWSYYRLGEFIDQKATPHDIPVEQVDAYNTSQTCSRCGETEGTGRRGVHFTCESCGYEQHADANAAVNIAKRFAGNGPD